MHIVSVNTNVTIRYIEKNLHTIIFILFFDVECPADLTVNEELVFMLNVLYQLNIETTQKIIIFKFEFHDIISCYLITKQRINAQFAYFSASHLFYSSLIIQ